MHTSLSDYEGLPDHLPVQEAGDLGHQLLPNDVVQLQHESQRFVGVADPAAVVVAHLFEAHR
jgi:hypothetical protein